MAKLQDIIGKIKPEAKEILLRNASGEFSLLYTRLTMGDFKFLLKNYGVNFFAGSDEIKLTPEIVCAMFERSLRKNYDDVSVSQIEELIDTVTINQPEFIGAMTHLQGGREEDVERQVERLRAGQTKKDRENKKKDQELQDELAMTPA